MTAPLLLVGAGGFGRETVEAVHAVNAVTPTWELVGFLDDRSALLGGAVDGTPVVGPVAAIADHPDARVVVCTGSPRDFASRRRELRTDIGGTAGATHIGLMPDSASTTTPGTDRKAWPTWLSHAQWGASHVQQGASRATNQCAPQRDS